MELAARWRRCRSKAKQLFKKSSFFNVPIVSSFTMTVDLFALKAAIFACLRNWDFAATEFYLAKYLAS